MQDRLGPGLQAKAWETLVAPGSYIGWRARLVPKQDLCCHLAASQPGLAKGQKHRAQAALLPALCLRQLGVSYASFKAHPRRPLLEGVLWHLQHIPPPPKDHCTGPAFITGPPRPDCEPFRVSGPSTSTHHTLPRALIC